MRTIAIPSIHPLHTLTDCTSSSAMNTNAQFSLIHNHGSWAAFCGQASCFKGYRTKPMCRFYGTMVAMHLLLRLVIKNICRISIAWSPHFSPKKSWQRSFTLRINIKSTCLRNSVQSSFPNGEDINCLIKWEVFVSCRQQHIKIYQRLTQQTEYCRESTVPMHICSMYCTKHSTETVKLIR